MSSRHYRYAKVAQSSLCEMRADCLGNKEQSAKPQVKSAYAARAQTLSFAFTLFCFYDQVSVFLRYERSDYTLPLILRLSHCRVVHFFTLCPVETMTGPS